DSIQRLLHLHLCFTHTVTFAENTGSAKRKYRAQYVGRPGISTICTAGVLQNTLDRFENPAVVFHHNVTQGVTK
ncbi:MAG: hypothetical protein ACU0CF_01360, partial [Sagittula sp.]|uniref:hypothetical protein n=1 Tax=Sagittula sp. TaxID=2038081 RepID=UPI00405A30A4